MPAKLKGGHTSNAPIAGPPTSALRVRVDDEDDSIGGPDSSWNVREWATSLLIHALLLLMMAFWYFSPPSKAEIIIDSRLIGSDRGVEDAMFPTGGLNTTIELTRLDLTPPEPLLEFSPSLDPSLMNIKPKPKKPEPKPEPEATDKPSGGNGLDNPNPGAGNGDGFGLAKFGDGGESIQGVQVKVGDPQFTLIWDSEADLDLHVIEPGGKEINWEDPKGNFGGELDVDNSKGYGPENVYWLEEDPVTKQKVKGRGPAGDYRWYVKFWGGLDGKVRPTGWKVRVKHAGQVQYYTGRFRVLNQKSKVETLKVGGAPEIAKDATPKP